MASKPETLIIKKWKLKECKQLNQQTWMMRLMHYQIKLMSPLELKISLKDLQEKVVSVLWWKLLKYLLLS
jgi:hypothetical protein